MQQKQEKHLRNVVVVFLAALLILGVYFIFREARDIQDTTFTYNNVDFTTIREEGFVRYQFPIYINNAKEPAYVEIRNDPRTLTEIKYDASVKSLILGKSQLYVTMPKNASGLSVAAYVEIKKILGNPALWNMNTTGAFIEAVPGYLVKNCEDATAEEAIIEFRTGAAEVLKENNCAVLAASTEEDLLRVVDKFTLIILGIDK